MSEFKVHGAIRGSGDPVFTLYVGTIAEATAVARHLAVHLESHNVDNGLTAWDAVGVFQGVREHTVVIALEAPKVVLESVLGAIALYAIDARYVHVDIKSGSRPDVDWPGSVYVDLDEYRQAV